MLVLLSIILKREKIVKKILLLLALSSTLLFSAMNLQKASKDDLMCIKGIGEKKAEAIIKYRKKSKISKAEDLLKIKGFGEGIVKNVKKGVKTAACGGKKSKTK